MSAQKNTLQLSSLVQWSQDHIRDVFESSTDEGSMRAVEETFAKNLNATVNGRPLGYAEIKQMVLMMRKQSACGLKVQWLQTVQVPHDSSNRDGSFGGMYIIHGIQKILPGRDKPTEFSRHKTVTVSIESQSTDPTVDTRRIVTLAFVASDLQVNREAVL
ncbi:hypothetical protein BDZ97DRAFT_1650197 [Flammula alnicola]|nr:hypothetical protein BDZ97DRAFT_1650197 [Flammula alnicola]